MTHAQMLYLARELEIGRPLAALLMANEWMEASHPMRRAFALQAKRALTNAIQADVLQSLMVGRRLSELDSAAQSELKAIKEQPRHYRSAKFRLARREFSSSEIEKRYSLRRNVAR